MQVAPLESFIRSIPDFPKPGILFRDITPLLQDAQAFKAAVDLMTDAFRDKQTDYVVAVEARGYIFGAPIAHQLGAGFIPVRKPGKLPYESIKEEYALEYGTNILEMHRDALAHGRRVLIVDDLLATGGTAAATRKLVESFGAHVVGIAFLIELVDLHGRDKLPGAEVHTFIKF